MNKDVKLRLQKYYYKNRDKICLQHKKYYKQHKKEICKRNSEYYKKNKLKVTLKKTETYINNTVSEKHLKERYQLTIEDYNKLFQEQQGCCAICGKHQSELKHRLNVDHNHKTGKIRGLLCPKCNTALGVYEVWVKQFNFKIKDYLEKNNE